MCGIIGVYRPEGMAARLVLRGLTNMEYRGYDSWGIIAKTMHGKAWCSKQIGSVKQRDKNLESKSAHIAIGHTRWATHGGITIENTHPHLDPTGRYAVVHNGVIENWQALKQQLTRAIFTSQTDTEIIVHLLADLPPAMPLIQKLKQVGAQLTGQNAFLVLDTKLNQIGAINLGSPLLIAHGEDNLQIASDVAAFSAAMSKYTPLDQDEVVVSSPQGWQTTHSHQWHAIKPSRYSSKNNSPGYYLWREINQIPEVIKRSVQQPIRLSQRISTSVSTIWLTGAGSAYYVALQAAQWFRFNHQAAFAFPSTESESYVSIAEPNDIVIAISQSGETRDTLIAINNLKPRVHSVIGIINRHNSSLSRIVDQCILTPAGDEQSVLATKSIMAQLVILYRLVDGFPKIHAPTLSRGIKHLITSCHSSAFDQIYQQLLTRPWIPIIGEGTGWNIAQEAALKFKEGAYLPADGIAGGELKHGSLALIDERSFCIALDVDTDHHSKLLNHVAEMKARKAVIAGIATNNNQLFDIYVPIPDLGPLTLLGGLVTTQILTYQLAIHKGINPDRPKNLAKSVTVI